jgi:hypothetical protein
MELCGSSGITLATRTENAELDKASLYVENRETPREEFSLAFDHG